MTRLGMTAGYQYFDPRVTAHVQSETYEGTGFQALCGVRLAALRDEDEIQDEKRLRGLKQKMCTRCAKRRERGER